MLLPVCWRDEVMQVEWFPGEFRALRMHGHPIAAQGATFTPHQFCTSYPVPFLEVIQAVGVVETWFFSPDLDYLCNDARLLPPADRQRLEPFAYHGLGLLWAGLIENRALAGSADFQEVMALRDTSRYQMLSISNVDARSDAEYFYVDDFGTEDALLLQAPKGRVLKVHARPLKALFASDMVDPARAACATGLLSVTSPFSGRECGSDTSICATEIIYWYRFHDTETDTLFYCIASLHHCRIVALYVPGHRFFILQETAFRTILEAMFGGSMEQTMLRHLAGYANHIQPYLSLPKRSITLLYGEEHVGHHLWNEVTGLHAFLAEPVPDNLPAVIEMSPRSEMYGRLDQLFPELAGRMIRHYGRREALLIRFYQDGLCIVRPTKLTVRESLRQRLAAFVERQDYIEPERERLAQNRMAGLPIVALALRTENRTLVDPVRFFSECIAHIARRSGPVCVVLDGSTRTMHGEASIRTTNAAAATTEPMLAEAAIAQALAASLEPLGCPVVCNVDVPMGVSLFWLAQAAFFIGPWGAGLARPRWVANRPGIMLSNTANLSHHDINIYVSPVVTEDAAPLLVVDPACIIDRPDQPTLVPGAPGLGTNFDISFDCFVPCLDAMIERHLPCAAPPSPPALAAAGPAAHHSTVD